MRAKRALYGKKCVLRSFLTNLIFFNLRMASHTDGYIFFSAHCKHVPCSTLTHSANEVPLNIKRKGDTNSRNLSRTSDTTETRNPCVLKVILLSCSTYKYCYFQMLLNLFWHTDKKKYFCAEGNFWDLVRNESSIEWD